MSPPAAQILPWHSLCLPQPCRQDAHSPPAFSAFPAFSVSLCLAAPHVLYLTPQFHAEEELPLLLLQPALLRKVRAACTQRGQPRSPPLGSKGLRELGW